MRDVTAYLMGDPCTAIRRAPTPIEMMRDTHEIKWSRRRVPMIGTRIRKGTKTSVIWEMKPGDTQIRMTKGEAVYLYQRLRREGFGASLNKNKCGGGYLVTRNF